MRVRPQKYLHRLQKDKDKTYAFNNNQQFTLVCVFVYFALFVYM